MLPNIADLEGGESVDPSVMGTAGAFQAQQPTPAAWRLSVF